MFSNLKISSRLQIMALAVTVFTVALVALGYTMVNRMATVTGEMYNRGLVGSKLLADANNAVWELRFGIANYTLASPENRKKILEGRPALYATLEDNLKKYSGLASQSDQDASLKELFEAYDKYKAGAPRWFELIDAAQMEQAADYRAKVTNAAGSAMVKGIKTVIEKQLKINEDLERIATETARTAKGLQLVLGGVAVLVLLVAVVLTARAITKPLQKMQADIGEIERSSDFTRRIAVKSGTEFSVAADSMNKLLTTIQSSLRELLDRVDKVSGAASKLSASSSRVANGSVQQSEATASIAATLEEVTVSIGSVSDHARSALDISSDSGELSSRGNEIIQKTVAEVLRIAETMRKTSEVIGQLGQQSSEISSVVKVIKEVADQTNLLALNAAIEAARAGEQGRGFAVVADEVRKLAERTTKSTSEITQMISTIQQSSGLAVSSMAAAVTQMDGGAKLAQEASQAINLIKERSAQATTVVQEISTALSEQSSASHTIAAQVESFAQMTETNSSAVEEIASATHDLERLCNEMRSVGHRFKI